MIFSFKGAHVVVETPGDSPHNPGPDTPSQESESHNLSAAAPQPAEPSWPSPTRLFRRENALQIGAVGLAGIFLVGALALTLLQPSLLSPNATPTAGATLSVTASTDGLAPITFKPESLTAGASLPTFGLTPESSSLSRFSRSANLDTTIPTRARLEIEQYTVQSGDTVFGIADKFNLEPETILWGNPELVDSLNLLRPGKVLNILPINGALRVVQQGDTIEKVAEVYHSSIEDILGFAGNDVDPENPLLTPGQSIVIPGGWRETIQWQLPVASRTTVGPSGSGEPGSCSGTLSGPSGGYNFIWPANNHYLSGWDYNPHTHPGLDIAAGLGAPIYASETGVVVFSGWSTRGYGNLIIVDHGNGWQTAYAHLSQINYGCGQAVAQGQLLGLAGSSGNSTGPHLHFEMRSADYGRVNPWDFLP